MAVSAAELKVLLTAQDQMSGAIKSAEQSLVSLDKAAAGSGKTLAGLGEGIGKLTTTAAVGAVGGLALGLGAAVKSASDFEHAISGISAVSGATADELEGIRSTALQLGADTKFSATEAANGMEELVKAGVSMADVMGGAARASLDLAAAGEVSVGEAATITSNALNAFGLSGDKAAGVADTIAGAANASAIDVHEFGFSLAAAGAVASTVGLSFDDLAQGIAIMGQAGIKGSDAGTSLKTMLLNLQPATKEQKKLFRELGLTTAEGANQFFDATGKVKSMADIAGVLQGALGGMTEQQRLATLEVLFGSDAIRAGAVLTKAGAKGFEDMAEAMGKVTAQQVAEERLNNLQGSLEKLKGSLETAAIVIGSAFLPTLKDMTDAATELVNDNLPAMQAAAEGMANGFRAAVPVVAAFFQLLVTHGSTIATIAAALATLAILVTVTGWVNAAILTFTGLGATLTAAGPIIAGVVAVLGGPLTVAIGAIIALVALLVVAWTQNWFDIQGKTQAAIDFISGVIQTGLAMIQGFWEAHGATIMGIVQTVWAAIQAAVETAITLVQNVITFTLAAIQGDWTTAWEALKTILVTAWNAYSTVVETAGQAIINAARAIWETIIREGPAILNGINAMLIKALNDASDAAVAKANELGPPIVQGIINGILRFGPNPIASALGGLLQAAIEDAKRKFLQASSPSKYTAEELGVPMAEGVIQGFVDRLGRGSSVIGESIRAIVTTAIKYGIDPTIALALGKAESQFDPKAVGDSGHSVGLFQLHDQGQGAGMTRAQREDPWINAEKFLSQHGALFEALAGNFTGPELAARFGVKAERPADQSGAAYAAAFREIVAAVGMLPPVAREAAASIDASTQSMSVFDEGAAKAAVEAAHFEMAQGRLNSIIGQGFPQATSAGATSLKGFGMASQGIVDDLLAGNIGLDQAQRLMVMYAAQTGLATAPLQNMNAGLVTQEGALQGVLFAAAQVNPAYTETALALQSGAITAETATLNFLQLAASTQGVTAAVVPAQQAFATFAASFPLVNELMNANKLSGDALTQTLLGLANQSGLMTVNFDLATASGAELDAAFITLLEQLEAVDPAFGALWNTVKTTGTVTDATRQQFIAIMQTLTGTQAAVTATSGVVNTQGTPSVENYGAATAEARQVTATSWQAIQAVVRVATSTIVNLVKTASEAIKKELQSISDITVRPKADTSQLDKLKKAADAARKAIESIPGSRGGGGGDGRASGGPVSAGWPYIVGERGPELFVPYASGTILPNNMLSGDGGGVSGGTVVINVNAPVYGVNDMESVVITALDRAQRRGRA